MKRGSSEYCLVLGIDKPLGMSSHDVVNRVRRIFGERRVGHTGTLDPMAEGVLPVCVGPATRLDPYLTGHDKTYRVRIAFGIATTTDDAEGEILRRGEVPSELADRSFVERFVAGQVGKRKQLPPAYSAIKVNGKKAYEAARQGTIIDLAPRDIEVMEARLIAVGRGYALPGTRVSVDDRALSSDGRHPDAGPSDTLSKDDLPAIVSPRHVEGDWVDLPWWDVEFRVSKGTYIRSLARDAGVMLGCPSHVAALQRTMAGALPLEECVSLDTLEREREAAALDPVRLLGFRFAYADGALSARIANGAQLRSGELKLFVRRRASAAMELCACTAGVRESCLPPEDGEIVSVIVKNKLAALYEFNASRDIWRVSCVFQKGVSRGSCL